MIDTKYYNVVLKTQNDTEILKSELGDLIQEVEDMLRWTSEPPTEPGWYWLEYHLYSSLVEVIIRPGHNYLIWDYVKPFSPRNSISVAEMGKAKWAGPIPRPQENL